MYYVMLIAIVFYFGVSRPRRLALMRGAIAAGQAMVHAYREHMTHAATLASYRANRRIMPRLTLSDPKPAPTVATRRKPLARDAWEGDTELAPRRVSAGVTPYEAPQAAPSVADRITPTHAACIALWLDAETRSGKGRNGRGVCSHDVPMLAVCVGAVCAGRASDPTVLRAVADLAYKYRGQIMRAPAGSFTKYASVA